MSQTIIEYECPCCGAALKFSADTQKMACEYCDNSFDLDTVKAYAQASQSEDAEDFQWEAIEQEPLECQGLHSFRCGSCGGVLMTDEQTVATFCPYCESPTIVEDRISDTWKPDGIIAFEKTREDAQAAFLALCKKKPLLPKEFTQEHRLEKITGIYVPFWLYDCQGELDCSFKATRLHHWSDSRYRYTRTDHYLLNRTAHAGFTAIPMDASSKMDNAIMESIEPYDYNKLIPFEKAFLSGFLADKYDVEAVDGQERIRQRASQTLADAVDGSILGYATAVPTRKNLHIQQGSARYVLLPVWMLSTKYRDKTYCFAMNGQTGKMTGSFPICPKRSALWFAGICGAVTAIASLIGILGGGL